MTPHLRDHPAISQKKRKPRRAGRLPPRPCPTEHEECVRLAQWLDARSAFYIRIVNEGQRSPKFIADLKEEGWEGGASDYFIIAPVMAFVEMKRLRGSTTPRHQVEFVERAKAAGVPAGIFKGADAAIAWLKSLGFGS